MVEKMLRDLKALVHICGWQVAVIALVVSFILAVLNLPPSPAQIEFARAKEEAGNTSVHTTLTTNTHEIGWQQVVDPPAYNSEIGLWTITFNVNPAHSNRSGLRVAHFDRNPGAGYLHLINQEAYVVAVYYVDHTNTNPIYFVRIGSKPAEIAWMADHPRQ